ncbi:hypothetical protein TEA_014254 [Camellia sinensis var. sinensis]|uniref:Uncharacterized protein n=1 Tax=Camellia sinensis var. sinensis TaxID=542762 RepID=A0A4S4DWW7_CAMSN|nr:hypothetical protein TEA_014254 [Camellia sinensis var. sinensis]
MAKVDEDPQTPLAPKPSPNPKDEARIISQASSSNPDDNDASPSPKNPLSPKEFIVSVAAKISSQPLQNSDPDVWGVLTAISNNARKRQQAPLFGFAVCNKCMHFTPGLMIGVYGLP